LTRWAEFVLRRRKTVVFFWLAMVVVGVFSAGKTSNRLSVDFSLPGQPGYETSKQIIDTYGNGGEMAPSIVVVTVPETTTVQAQATRIDAVFDQIRQAVPTDRIVDYASTANPVFITADQRTTYALAYPAMFKSFTQKLDTIAMQPVIAAAEDTTGFDWGVTGYQQLAQGSSKSNGPSVLTETLFGGLGALAVLAFLFASFLALVPLVIAAVSILSTFSLILLGTYVFNISFVVQFLVALVGLGVAVDYSLLLVNRWREERAHGRENHDAIVTAMRYAGHAVVASAGTVAISLCALLVIPVPLLRSMGIGGMLIPLVSTAVVMTLLPAILGGIGPRVDWPRIRNESRASRAWTAWTRGVVRFRWPVAVGTLGLLVALLVPIFGIKIGQTQTDSLAHSGPAYAQFQTLTDGGVPTGVVSPMEILVKGPDVTDSVNRVVAAVKTVPGVSAILAPDNAAWRKDGTAIVDVIPTDEIVDSTQAHIAESVKSAISRIPGVVGVTGTGPAVLDYINAVYKNFPYTLAVIALVTFLLLVRTFRSILLPIKAVLLNILSVGATFGATVLFWQDGHGSKQLFGIAPTGAVEFWLPVLIFAFLFGLSMDYEVFILSRMREEYDRTGNTDLAVVEGLGRTGRLVTGAATILFLSFLALASSPGTDIKVFATALGIGILLDATVVRALLVPALVSLFVEWNWYLPDWVAKVLRIKPVVAPDGPRVPAQATGPGQIAEIPAAQMARFEL
jgi:RND superfamily putative drug exporter